MGLGVYNYYIPHVCPKAHAGVYKLELGSAGGPGGLWRVVSSRYARLC